METPNNVERFVRIILAVPATASFLEGMQLTIREAKIVLQVTLFILEEHIAHPDQPPEYFNHIVKEMIETELKATNDRQQA